MTAFLHGMGSSPIRAGSSGVQQNVIDLTFDSDESDQEHDNNSDDGSCVWQEPRLRGGVISMILPSQLWSSGTSPHLRNSGLGSLH